MFVNYCLVEIHIKYVFIFIIYEWQSVGGYGILAIPTLPELSSWFCGYGRDAIPSYYKSELLLII